MLAPLLALAAIAIVLWSVSRSDDQQPSGSEVDRGQIAFACEVPRTAISENPVASGEEYPTLYDNARGGVSQPTEALRFVQYKITLNDTEFARSFGKVYSSGEARWVSCDGPATPIIDRDGEPVHRYRR